MRKTLSIPNRPKRRISTFAENLLRKYGIREHDVRLSWIFDERALLEVTHNAQRRKLSAGLGAPPKLNLIGS